MTTDKKPKNKKDKLADALRANLMKRKQQARERDNIPKEKK